MNIPAGTVSFLFTDIEGSTRLWERYPQAMQAALAHHDRILRRLVESHGGQVIKSTGDGIHAAFETAASALSAALAAQQELASQAWQEIRPDVLRVRMGLYTGEAEMRSGDYYGPALNRAARLMSIAHGGQILLSDSMRGLIRESLPEHASLRDLGEHHLKDLSRPEHVFQLDHPSLRSEFPPLSFPDAVPHNLPVQLTSFVGRQRELAAARHQLESARLLTLIGPGGTGKTRLALELAAQQLPAFKDGAWLVELAPLPDPSLVIQAIASAFHVHEQAGMSLQDLLVNYLRARQLLLVLDNCEHMVEACARLSGELLRAAPGLKIIASSREALGVPGETVYRVPSLSLPDPEARSPEALAGSEAVSLFLERARAVDSNFALTPGNAQAIAQVCSRLDGIPLAIELAAARVAVFSPEQIAARLGDRFKLLTGGSRTALPRQQTLRALIDWSYEYLSSKEQALFQRLSVFAGGWTFEAAEALCADLDVLELLPQLVNKSLVLVEDGIFGRRYRYLETIRQYGLDKLLEAGEAQAMRNRHLEYFLHLAETATPRVGSAEASEWIPALEAEYDNLRVALEWSLDHDLNSLLRLVDSLAYFWLRRGRAAEGIKWASQALALAGGLNGLAGAQQSLTNEQARLGVLRTLIWLKFNLGDPPGVVEAGEACILAARRLDDRPTLALALTLTSAARLAMGDSYDVFPDLEEAVAISRQPDEKFLLAFSLGILANAAERLRHDSKTAGALEAEAVLLVQQSRKTWSATMQYFGLARSAIQRRDFAAARQRLELCLHVFEEMGDPHRVNMIHSELAHLDRYEGHYDRALRQYRRTFPVWQALGHRAAVAHQLECIAFIAARQSQPERAACLLGAAEALREAINIAMTPDERLEYEGELASLRQAMGEESLKSSWAEGRLMSMDAAIEYALQEGRAPR